ncbi:MAG: hypothetical protein VZS44_03475 [Bacilli bacterium]|nr:hypothetical protein [Bacilli bacterium]
MVLRKPYGFLIKHFKMIHLVLTVLYIYLAMKVNNMLRYYNNFIAGKESKLNAIKYATNYYLIAIILSIAICLVIYALMRYKKKPKLFYVVLMAIYLAITLVIIFAQGGLNTIYIGEVSSKELRLYHDLLQIIIIFQYLTILVTLIRGLGFDIKKFNFKEDIAELQLDVTDNEEVELTIGSTEGILRRIRRQLRELKYYYKENKLFIDVIGILFTVIIVLSIIVNIKIVHKSFKEGEEVSTDKYSFTVTNSYLTNKSFDGDSISDANNTFLLAQIFIYSKVGRTELNTGNITLKTEHNTYTINTRYTTLFKDVGVGFKDQIISTPRSFLFIFVISNAELKDKMQIHYIGDIKIDLNPINLDKSVKTTNLQIGESIDLGKTVLSSGKIAINRFDVKNSYTYNYEYEIYGKKYTSKLNIISPNKTILYLNLTNQNIRGISDYDLIKTYGTIKYKIADTEFTIKTPINKTPTSYKDGIFIEVDKQMEQATSIWIEFNIRNQKYIYTLK